MTCRCSSRLDSTAGRGDGLPLPPGDRPAGVPLLVTSDQVHDPAPWNIPAVANTIWVVWWLVLVAVAVAVWVDLRPQGRARATRWVLAVAFGCAALSLWHER